MKIKIHKDKNDLGEYLTFKGKCICGTLWWDGSGSLEIKQKNHRCIQDYFASESGNHKDRVASIKYLADAYTAAYNELKKLPKVKLKKGKAYD